MKYRVAMWATVGFLVAGFWALLFLATFPHTNERMRDMWAFVIITCPIAVVRRYPISLYEVLAANAITYGMVGLIMETLLKRLHHAQHFKKFI